MGRGFVGWLVAGLLFAMPLGCKSSAASVCDDKCDCEYCSDREYDLCLDYYEAWEADADRWDCDEIYDAWMDCQEDTWRCRGGDFDTDCGYIRKDLEDCTRR
ncbi:MAG: hypothetical protein JRI23_13975 [Deltaproteobacteria bacterium]|nr:hypothetical protein [Deltaproteobacteria bacterium]MBW2532838.1 hypothetical protein [Deltaproteobacteria bacterium]